MALGATGADRPGCTPSMQVGRFCGIVTRWREHDKRTGVSFAIGLRPKKEAAIKRLQLGTDGGTAAEQKQYTPENNFAQPVA